MAGLFEGEGCFQINPRDNGVQIKVSMTDRDVIEKLHGLSGMGTYKALSRRTATGKQVWCWLVSNRDDALVFVDAVEPWLGQRRREKLGEVRAKLAASRGAPASRTHCPSGHPYSAENTKVTAAGRECRTCKREYHFKRTTACPAGHAYDETNSYVNARGHRRCRRCAEQCPAGHVYDETNAYINKKGSRVCRQCKRERATRAAEKERV